MGRLPSIHFGRRRVRGPGNHASASLAATFDQPSRRVSGRPRHGRARLGVCRTAAPFASYIRRTNRIDRIDRIDRVRAETVNPLSRERHQTTAAQDLGGFRDDGASRLVRVDGDEWHGGRKLALAPAYGAGPLARYVEARSIHECGLVEHNAADPPREKVVHSKEEKKRDAPQ